jgi:hypothetical protein
LENLEALYKLMGQYKAQVQEVGAMETDLDMAFQEVQAKQQLTDAEGNLVKAK